MLIEDIVEELRGGELSNHPWFTSAEIMTITNVTNIRNAINLALTDLYTRFPILTKELVIIQHSGLCQYWLLPRFAKTSESSEPIKYIDDTVDDPFLGNVLRVEAIQDEDGNDLTLNSNKECLVAFTPSPELIEIPNPVDTNALFVVYRTRPDKLTELTTEFLLPEQYRPALLAYVAYRAYSGMSDPQANNLAMMNFQKYEMLCAQYIHLGMDNTDDNLESCNFTYGGWL